MSTDPVTCVISENVREELEVREDFVVLEDFERVEDVLPDAKEEFVVESSLSPVEATTTTGVRAEPA